MFILSPIKQPFSCFISYFHLSILFSTVSPPVLSASAARLSTRTRCGAGEGGEGGEGDEAATPAGKGAVERGRGEWVLAEVVGLLLERLRHSRLYRGREEYEDYEISIPAISSSV